MQTQRLCVNKPKYTVVYECNIAAMGPQLRSNNFIFVYPSERPEYTHTPSISGNRYNYQLTPARKQVTTKEVTVKGDVHTERRQIRLFLFNYGDLLGLIECLRLRPHPRYISLSDSVVSSLSFKYIDHIEDGDVQNDSKF